MDQGSIEVRYYSPRIGYSTEEFRNTSPQVVLNLIRARAGNDATVSWMKYHPPAPSERSDGGGPSGRRW